MKDPGDERDERHAEQEQYARLTERDLRAEEQEALPEGVAREAPREHRADDDAVPDHGAQARQNAHRYGRHRAGAPRLAPARRRAKSRAERGERAENDVQYPGGGDHVRQRAAEKQADGRIREENRQHAQRFRNTKLQIAVADGSKQHRERGIERADDGGDNELFTEIVVVQDEVPLSVVIFKNSRADRSRTSSGGTVRIRAKVQCCGGSRRAF